MISNNQAQSTVAIANSIFYKLDEYWKITDNITTIATILDPRIKCSVFTQEEITKAINIIKKEMELYTVDISPLNNATTSSLSPIISNGIDAYNYLQNLANQFRSIQSVINRELEKYLDLPEDNNCVPLMWWKSHKKLFPILSTMAQNYLTIQSSFVSCEQSFSFASLTNFKLQNQFDQETTRALLCLKSWISEKIGENDMDNPDSNNGRKEMNGD